MSGGSANDPRAWGSSILAILAEHHGLAVSPRALRRLFNGGASLTLTALVEAAEAFGFETQAGQLPSYEDLRDLPVLPAVVHFRKKVAEKMLALGSEGILEDVGREGRFVVVHHADDGAVELEDPEEGRLRMPRSEFEAAWRGIVVCVAPTEDQEPRREGAHVRLAGWLDGVSPLLGNVLGCTLLFALGAFLAKPLGGRAAMGTLITIAAALAASVWAAFTTVRCAACAAAAKEVGVPLAPLGILYYAGLLAALGLWGLVPFTAAAILAAAGVHLALLAHLAAARVRCPACTAAAAAAWAAAGISLADQGWGWPAAALPATALGARLALPLLTQRTERRRLARLATVRETLAAEAHPPSGSLRLIVYKRETCNKCRILEKEILPPLAERLGERLTIERRPAGDRFPAPTVILLGGERRVAIIGLPDLEDFRQALA